MKKMFEEIKEIICEYTETDPGEITENSRFIDDLGMNSYNIMCAVGDLEDAFDIGVEESDVAGMRTLGDVVEYVKSKQE